jgi:hypothetical protein
VEKDDLYDDERVYVRGVGSHQYNLAQELRYWGPELGK